MGGASVLPMKDLVALFGRLGFAEARSYIQSGNVVFKGSRPQALSLAKRIPEELAMSHGFKTRMILLALEEMEEAVSSNPFPEGEEDPKSLNIYFLAGNPSKPDMESLEQVKSSSERFSLLGKVFYLYAPDGVGRSKLAASVERRLGVEATARNLRTTLAVLKIARDLL